MSRGVSHVRILAIDTALGACAACVLASGQETPLAHESIAMERGHAEALLPLVDRVVSSIEGGFSAIDRVAVTIGPGTYTGLRVGVSAARAIGLAAGIPVVGVTTLSALLAPLVGAEHRRLAAAAVDARHGHVYFQAVAPGGRSIVAAGLIAIRDAVRLIGSGPVVLTGSGAPLVAAEALACGVDASVYDAAVAPDIALVARLGLVADPAHALAKPLYLRGPDARPQDHARIARQ